MLFPPPKRNLTYFCFLAVVGLGLLLSQGFAAGEPELATGFLDDLTKQFQDRAGIWEEHFRIAAVRVFRTLLLIDFVYVSFDILFLKGEDLRSWAGEILRQVLIIGFFSWVLFNSGEAVSIIQDGFSKLAGIATEIGGENGNQLTSPSSILYEGFKNGAKVTLKMRGILSWDVIDMAKALTAHALTGGLYSVLADLIGLAITIIYAMIACRLLITQIEVYVSLSCGVLVLAFGGSRWTREPAIRYCWFLIALAFKLFTIYMVVSLGNSIINDLFLKAESAGFLGNIKTWFMMIACLLIWVVILWVIPNSVAQLVSHIGGVGGGGAAGASAAAGLIGGSLSFAGSAVATAAKGAAVAATPATGGAGLAVAAAIGAGEKAMQIGAKAATNVASQAAGGQGSGGGSLGGIASRSGSGNASTAISSGQAQSSKKTGSSSAGGARGAAAAGGAAASAANTALGGVAKGVTGTISGAASLGANGTLNGQRTSSSSESSAQQREAIKRSQNRPQK